MGTAPWVVNFYDLASEACTLSPRTATVWLTDPDTGQDVKLQRDDTPPAKITIQPGQLTGFVLTMATVALESATIGPAVCVQANERGSPAGSLLALPSSVTKAPEATV